MEGVLRPLGGLMYRLGNNFNWNQIKINLQGDYTMNNLKFYLIDKDKIELIKPLWVELNRYHQAKSIYFEEDFSRNTFENRIRKLNRAESLLRIEVVEDITKEELVAYSISSVSSKKIGEIDSIYVKKEYRRMNLGDRLMKGALRWLAEEKVDSKKIAVAYGNEEVWKFYVKYGFKPRITILED
ncbi:acetyltransferase (GNAT) family protein [Orenia metallireducens]|uniref:Acetyltransferase (GNAT) family protein n=2 Tax=Orenia metallireducens TaxID=1413210 RepID=A0A285GWN0_9FIRM|nr:acetyltransferase (GNAT) family protein [Orenia metallireducens]SNY27979.1 Acetyltransferase (GNAT) family protein [Orenia metallireducens]